MWNKLKNWFQPKPTEFSFQSYHKLERKNDGYYITHKKEYTPIAPFKRNTIKIVCEFAYKMSFGGQGKHRHHRSGGTHSRKNGEIFANAFQGKLAEFAVYNLLHKCGNIDIPDLETYGLGEWDATDLTVCGKKISVKSTKSFGNLLLLETKDWNSEGIYIPNFDKGSGKYDYLVLVRLKPECESLLKKERLLFSDNCSLESLQRIIQNHNWDYDIVGYITYDDICQMINQKLIIHQGTMLNGKTRMDADNYYVQTGDMRDITELIKKLKEE